MPEFDSERLKKLIEAFKSAEEQVQTVLLGTNAESVEDYKFKVDKKLDKVSVSLMKESIDWAEKDLPKAYREGEKRTDTHLEGSHAVAFGKLSDAAIETPYIELARHTQYANDYQKEIIDKAITEAEKEGYGATVEKVKNIIQDTLAKDNASMIVQYSNGTKMPLDKYAEMLARTSRIETANKGSFDRCRKLGIDLVRCTKVPNCCPYCQMYEDKVYSISGNDTRFPALYETALQRGYDIMHPNCRHEFIPFIEEFYTDEEMQELIKNSNHFEELSPDNRIFKTYNKNQALLRQWNEERHEFNKMQAEYKARGEEPPYTTLGGFRRARRAESTEYKKLHYRDRDERLYENWKSVVGKENMPKTLDKFQEIRYNDEKEYRALQEFKQYRAKNPETTITREEYQVVSKIKEIGLKGEPILKPDKIDTKDYSFSDDHINKTDHHRNITKEQAEGFIDRAVFSLKQWKGQRIVFYSNDGATVIDTGKKKIVSSFSKVDFDDKVKNAIQEAIKWKK